MEKYKLIKNFLTKEEQKLLSIYCDITHRHNFNNFDGTNNVMDTSFYGDYIMESLMINKKKNMEEHLNLKLLPTYSFWRLYTQGSTLPEHKDRPSCEYSVTVQISHDKKNDWPIFMDGNKIILEDGDAVVYKGCDVKHSREDLKGDWHAQVFLHYVNENGPNAEWALDKRRFWGLQRG
tara:strand:- start:348 stop:881 length:534 start_codon:yes stop_codon:yes gene_type:complete